MHSWLEHVKAELDELDRQSRRRRRGGLEAPSSVVDFSSNDYLGLRRHPEVVAATRNAAEAGAGASSVLSGYGEPHRRLERALAGLSSREDALLFSSGYAANVGVVSCLATGADLILSDQLNHASLIDGCRLSPAPVHVFPHLDFRYVCEYLQMHRASYDRVLLLTESVFSMDGDIAPITQYVEICNQFGCGLIVDEAHGVGVFGDGAGILAELNAEADCLLKLGTLSKAVGTIGGYAAGDRLVIEFLVNRCRSYLFSTAAMPAGLLAATHAVEMIPRLDGERQHVRRLARDLRTKLRRAGWRLGGSSHSAESAIEDESPILPIIIGDERQTLALQSRLLSAGIQVPAIRPPTVPEGTCRLRVSLSATHTVADCERLAEALGEPNA